MRNLETDEKRNLVTFNKNLNFENQKEFWNGFNSRQSSNNCE